MCLTFEYLLSIANGAMLYIVSVCMNYLILLNFVDFNELDA